MKPQKTTWINVQENESRVLNLMASFENSFMFCTDGLILIKACKVFANFFYLCNARLVKKNVAKILSPPLQTG